MTALIEYLLTSKGEQRRGHDHEAGAFGRREPADFSCRISEQHASVNLPQPPEPCGERIKT